VLNFPLFLFGWRTMGGMFAAKSLLVTIATAWLVAWMPDWLTIADVNPGFAAVAGGTIVGMGAVAAARHGAAAGGTLVLVLWLQRRFSINGGSTQLVFDLAMALLATLCLGWGPALWSVLGIFATDVMIMTWYRPIRKQSETRLADAPSAIS
jgi:uncharacterized membrane-anchored protein YitT (DUF2179 family)